MASTAERANFWGPFFSLSVYVCLSFFIRVVLERARKKGKKGLPLKLVVVVFVLVGVVVIIVIALARASSNIA